MMVTMVKMPECIDEMVHTYRFENYEKYYYYASNRVPFRNGFWGSRKVHIKSIHIFVVFSERVLVNL